MRENPGGSLRPMMVFRIFLLTVLVSGIELYASGPDFQREVRPVLASHCFKCHGPDETARKSKLRLDVREAALKGGKSGKLAIVPEHPEESELVRRVFTSDEDDVMPPPAAKLPLKESEKEILKEWIKGGAEYKPHWAFVKPVQPPVPAVHDTSWPKNEIDRFVLARLEKEGLKPSRQADRYTLVRRLYLDLIGLPPTPQQADAFKNDARPDAYERLVDELLASPHYGERWARRWLDLARYADTNGYEKDRPRSIWPYRDWVIKALNNDLPFDQFTIDQIAGDMLPHATPDQIVATGFNRNTMINEEGGIDPLEFRFYSMVDRVHVTATTWLGLTMACAQCHTHKYDPIQHTEYYKFMALLNNADEPVVPVKNAEIAARRAEIESKAEALENSLLDRFPPETRIAWSVPPGAEFQSESGANGEYLDDGSFRVTGTNPEKDTYTLKFELPPGRITHVQIEAMPDDKIGGGPGRTDHGNFVLSEFLMEVRDCDCDVAHQVLFNHAEADYSQEGFAPENAIDGKTATGWAVAADREKRYDRHATFTLAEPLTLVRTVPAEIRMVQKYGRHHTLGRFRIRFGNDLSAGGTVEQRRQEALERKFAKWVRSETETVTNWKPFRPESATSASPTLTIESDGSVFASGDFTKSDTFHLKFAHVPAGARAIRLEVLPDDRLPANGPGTVHYEGPNGDFWLSNVKAAEGGKAIGLTNASQSFADGKNTAAKAIDDDLQSGWSINGGQGKSHNAVFQFAAPLEKGGEVEVDLTFERYYAAALGHFRVWFTTDFDAKASPVSNPADAVLLKYRGEENVQVLLGAAEAKQDRELLLKEFARLAPELAPARKEIADLRASAPKFPTTLVMRERAPGFARVTHVHHRGEFLQAKEAVQPGVPAFLPQLPADEPANRLALARWLVSPENPLTARVTVNRQWEAFFGRGIVRTLEDFGFQGELPSHPELLDWLAVEFMKEGWSMKRVHKLIVMSATYQQSSHASPELAERDPQNILLARGPRFRVEAELVRDTALADAGLLSDKLGGPSVFPPQPAGVSTEGAYGALKWNTSEGADRYRRGLYTFAKRTTPYAMTATFDGPSGEACLARRDRSNTPLQALTLLNDEAFMEAARALGSWAAAQGKPAPAVVETMFRRCLTRPPSESEKEKLAGFYKAELTRFSSGALSAAALLKEKEGDHLNEKAAWTTLARVLLNLDESITKE